MAVATPALRLCLAIAPALYPFAQPVAGALSKQRPSADGRLAASVPAGSSAVAATGSALGHAAAGDLWFRKGRFAEAESAYHRALALDEHLARAWLGLARVLQTASMYET